MAIKKAFQPLIEFLEQNKQKNVNTILEDVKDMCSAKSGGGAVNTVLRNDDKEVVAVFCYYHKQWELVDEVEYGKKASSATGLNNMCKEGTSAWTKQQSVAKKANGELLKSVAALETPAEDILDEQAKIEEARKSVAAREDGHGFETADEVAAYLEAD